jgi:hypothetical protein
MRDPVDGRALDARLPPYVKDLLVAEREAPPPPRAAEERVRARVAATVVAAGLAGTAGAATAAGATAKAAGAGAIGSALGVKASLIVVAIAVGATATGGYVAHARRARAPVQTTFRPEPARRAAVATVGAPAPAFAPQPQRVPVTVDNPPVVAAAAARTPRRRAAKRSIDDVTLSPSPSPAGLDEENAPIAAALAALARGAPAEAIAALERHARAFPRGQLEEEREALWIQALIAAGDVDQARSRADGFRRRFPGSIQDTAVAAALAKIP